MDKEIMLKKVLDKKKKNKRGFTLVELIVVITIIAILAALLVPAVARYVSQASDARGFANARQVYTAGAAYAASEISEGRTPDGAYTSSKNSGTDIEVFMSKNTSGGWEIIFDDGAVTSATWWTEGVRNGDSFEYPSMDKN